MRSRKLKNRITFYGFESVSDGCGGRIEGYNKKGSVWCKMRPFGSNDKGEGGKFEQPLIDQQNTSVVSYTTKLRKLCGFTPLKTDIISFHGRFMEIYAITNIEEEDFGFAMHFTYFAKNTYTILDQAGMYDISGNELHDISGDFIYNILGEVS